MSAPDRLALALRNAYSRYYGSPAVELLEELTAEPWSTLAAAVRGLDLADEEQLRSALEAEGAGHG